MQVNIYQESGRCKLLRESSTTGLTYKSTAGILPRRWVIWLSTHCIFFEPFAALPAPMNRKQFYFSTKWGGPWNESPGTTWRVSLW